MRIDRPKPARTLPRFLLGGMSLVLALFAAFVYRSLVPSSAVEDATPGSEPEETRSGSYLGQALPGDVPELFAPGLVSTDEAVELNGVVSPDGRELFFTRMTRGSDGAQVFRMHRFVQADDGSWRGPEQVAVYPGNAPSLAVDMAYSPDGRRLYFLGRHPHELSPENPGLDLWVSERSDDGGWSLGRPLPPPVWTEGPETYPVVAPDGSIQFASQRPGGVGERDLWRAAPLEEGGFAEPVNLGPLVNSEHTEADSAIAPDDSYLVVQSTRPGGPGQGDLWVSFRGADGGWGEPILLGGGINTEHTDYCPMVTPDGRFLFFSRRVSEPIDAGWDGVVAGDVYWVSTAVIERLREEQR